MFFSRVDVSKGLTIAHMASHPPNARYPDATAVTYDEQNFKATVIYNDHSVYVWDVRDIKKVRIIFSFVIKLRWTKRMLQKKSATWKSAFFGE